MCLAGEGQVGHPLAEELLHLTPVELHVVVAAHQHQLAAQPHEAREPPEERLVILQRAIELDDDALGLAAQAELLLFVGDLEGELEASRLFSPGATTTSMKSMKSPPRMSRQSRSRSAVYTSRRSTKALSNSGSGRGC
jgi:hypothetical protein